MLRKLFVIAVILAVIGLGVFWFVTIPATVTASALAAYTPNAANGREMFYAGGCTACHATPGQDDKTRLGGGLGLKSPFGTFFVPNISPDPNDGIGQWKEADFVSAMQKGTSSTLAKVCASSVLPQPVGPTSRIFDFCSSTSSTCMPEDTRL